MSDSLKELKIWPKFDFLKTWVVDLQTQGWVSELSEILESVLLKFFYRKSLRATEHFPVSVKMRKEKHDEHIVSDEKN